MLGACSSYRMRIDRLVVLAAPLSLSWSVYPRQPALHSSCAGARYRSEAREICRAHRRVAYMIIIMTILVRSPIRFLGDLC